MKYNIIGSSSKGNAIIVENFMLLDCGVSYTKLSPYLKSIKIIFISHLHQDHLNIRAIRKIGYNYPNIKYICRSKDIVEKLLTIGYISPKNIYILDKPSWYDLGMLKVKLEPVEHDVSNSCLHFEIKDKKGIYIVDTCSVSNIKAKNYDMFFIESNYRKDILKKHIEECEDKNKLIYLNRVAKTHLSFEDANSFLIENMSENSNYEYIHQSKYNFEEVKE